MAAARYFPTRGRVYSYEELINLRNVESPCLMVKLLIPGFTTDFQPIQSYDTEAEMESLKALSFKYIKTTDEYIPVYHCVNTEEEILKVVDIDVYLDNFSEEEKPVSLWICPKSDPKNQFYKLSEGNMVSNSYEEPRPLREALVNALEDLKVWKILKGL